MKKMIARFVVNTPLFCGGADNEREAELRVPSIKGALRFWWRALAFARFVNDVKAMREEENSLFGSADTGQGSFLLRVSNAQPMHVFKAGEAPFRTGSGARYLGFGVLVAFGENGGNLTKACLKTPLTFDLEFVSRKDFDTSVIQAVKALGLLGGFGAKARKGYGSLTLRELSIDGQTAFKAPDSEESFTKEVQNLLTPSAGVTDQPGWSAFNTKTRVDILATVGQPLDLLNEMGLAMQRYRGWGYKGMVNGKPSEKNFKDDHDWSKNPELFPHFHPRRVVFGLPHNYSRFLQCNPVGEPEENMKIGDRRASPLILHVHAFDDKRYAAVATVIKSQFLPDWAKIKAGPNQVAPSIDWKVIDDFLDGPPPGSINPRYFPKRHKVFPS